MFELVEAFADVLSRNGALRLTFAGEGPARAELAARCERLGIDSQVDFAGRVPYERLGHLFDEVDCLVLPSYSEGMPLSVLEAAAHRRVIVASDVGDLPRLFGDQIHLCRARDVNSLATALDAAIEPAATRHEYADVMKKVSVAAVVDAMFARLGVTPRS